MGRFAACAVAVLAAVSAVLASPPGPVGAITAGQFALEPLTGGHSTSPRTDFSYILRPGQTERDAVQLSNYTAATQTFELYGADGYNVTPGGALGLQSLHHHNVGVGAWIHLPVQKYTVPAHTTTTFQFDVAVPADASPGDHVGGIVALDVTKNPTQRGKVRVTVHEGIAVAVYVRVAGPLHPNLAITAVGTRASEPALAFIKRDSSAVLYATLRNTGNVQLRAAVKIKVTGPFGGTVKTFKTIQLPVLVPGSTFTVQEPSWHPLPFAGPAHIQVTVVTDDAGTVTGGATLWVIPWVLVLIVFLVLALIVLAIWRRRIRRRKSSDGRPPAEPEQGEPDEGEPDEELASTGGATR